MTKSTKNKGGLKDPYYATVTKCDSSLQPPTPLEIRKVRPLLFLWVLHISSGNPPFVISERGMIPHWSPTKHVEVTTKHFSGKQKTQPFLREAVNRGQNTPFCGDLKSLGLKAFRLTNNARILQWNPGWIIKTWKWVEYSFFSCCQWKSLLDQLVVFLLPSALF